HWLEPVPPRAPSAWRCCKTAVSEARRCGCDLCWPRRIAGRSDQLSFENRVRFDPGELVQLVHVAYVAGGEEAEPRVVTRDDQRLQPVDLAASSPKGILCALELDGDRRCLRFACERQVSLDQEHGTCSCAHVETVREPSGCGVL